MKKTVIALALMAACLPAYCQLQNTLLWRISGKGLSAPSYLYGTMHLTDKKVFNFGDSVYKAIEQTEGFAAELDMNRIGLQMINYMIADREARAATEPVKVKDVVSPATWEMYKDKLAKKFYKRAEQITIDDLDVVESSLQYELFKRGDMPTFLDAWLFDLARKQGKWVGGLEELQEQMEHINADDVEGKIQMALFDDGYYRTDLKKMVDIYLSQALDSIDAYMYKSEGGKKDYIMIKRNLKMSRMMDSLSAVRPTFFAVGAAHLPGDSGVIALLRAKGFTVDPVISRKKISADKYVVKTKEAVWQPVNIPDSTYSVMMPGEAGNIEVLEDMGVNMRMFFDISTMKLYMTFGLEIQEERKKIGIDSLYAAMKARFASQGRTTSEKDITINGVEGKEYTLSSDEGEYRLHVFVPKMEYVILNAVFAFKEKSLSDPESIRFLRSFAYHGLKPKAPAPLEWSTQQYPLHAYSIEWPARPRETKDVNSLPGKVIQSYQFVDIKGQTFYGMNVYTAKEGNSDIGLDSSYFYSIRENMLANFSESEMIDSAFFSMNHYPAFRMTMSGKTNGERLEARVLSIVRGDRQYYVYTVYAPTAESRSRAQRFMGSFKLLPYKHPIWKRATAPDSSFSIVSAFPVKLQEESEVDLMPGSKRYTVYDSVMATTTFIGKTTIPAWCWFSSDTAFLRQRAVEYGDWSDSLVDYKVTRDGERLIADFQVSDKNRFVTRRVKMVLNGNVLYEVAGYYDGHDLANMYNRFFNEFVVHDSAVALTRAGSTSAQLVTYLADADKTKAQEVAAWWHYLDFKKEDVPLLQKMSLRLYPDFDSVYDHGLNARIFEELDILDSAQTMIAYLQEHYKNIKPADEHVKPYAISYLSRQLTSESYALIKDLLSKYSFNIREGLGMPFQFGDSLQLTAALYPGILKYAGKEGMSRDIVTITMDLLDRGLITRNVIRQEGQTICAYVKRMLKKDEGHLEENAYRYYPYISILGVINSPESNSLLARFAKMNNRHIRFKTMVAQLANNVPVDNRTIFTMATTDEYRLPLYDELKKLKKLQLFPRSFLSHEQLSKSALYKYHASERTISTVTYIGERTTLYEGKQQRFLLFKINVVDLGYDRAGPYLAVTGPWSLNKNDYSSDHSATGVFFEETYDPKNIDRQFKDYFPWVEKRNARVTEWDDMDMSEPRPQENIRK